MEDSTFPIESSSVVEEFFRSMLEGVWNPFEDLKEINIAQEGGEKSALTLTFFQRVPSPGKSGERGDGGKKGRGEGKGTTFCCGCLPYVPTRRERRKEIAQFVNR